MAGAVTDGGAFVGGAVVVGAGVGDGAITTLTIINRTNAPTIPRTTFIQSFIYAGFN